MEGPAFISADCPNCGETPHRVLKGRSGTRKRFLDATLRCNDCGFVHSAVIEEKDDIEVPVIISSGQDSTRAKLWIFPDELLQIGDELMVGEEYVQITGVELKERRVDAAKASNIKTLWTKRFERIQVPISINKGSKTVTKRISATPDEEFEVGDMVHIDGHKVAIHRIHPNQLAKRKAGIRTKPRVAQARHIARLYGRMIK